MARPEFTWFPDTGASCSESPSVTVTKFGNGYEARTSIGLNSSPEQWSVKFTRAQSEATAIINFLKTMGAKSAFTWKTPEGSTIVCVCRKWERSRLKGGAMQISCVFDQVFEY